MLSSSKVRDGSPSAFFQVLKLHQLVYAALENALAQHGLTPPQYTSLSLIRYHEPVTPAELSRKLGITSQSTLETVKSLEARGLILRAAIPNNRRSISLYLTDQGRMALFEADDAVLAAERAFFSKLRAKEFQQLQNAIRTLRSGASLLSDYADDSASRQGV